MRCDFIVQPQDSFGIFLHRVGQRSLHTVSLVISVDLVYWRLASWSWSKSTVGLWDPIKGALDMLRKMILVFLKILKDLYRKTNNCWSVMNLCSQNCYYYYVYPWNWGIDDNPEHITKNRKDYFNQLQIHFSSFEGKRFVIPSICSAIV